MGRKLKEKRVGDICNGTLNIEFEQDWTVGECKIKESGGLEKVVWAGVEVHIGL